MNYLQVWFGKKPKKKILDCMKTVMDNVGEDDTYTLISTTNFLKDNNKVNWIDINKYELEEIKKDEKLFIFYNSLDKLQDPDFLKSSYKSNIIRLNYLSNNNNVLYLDTDVVLKEKIIFKENKPHFAFFKRNDKIIKDSFVSYNGTCLNYFKKILNCMVSGCYDFRRDKLIFMGRGIIISFIMQFDIESESINDNYYEHLNMYEQMRK